MPILQKLLEFPHKVKWIGLGGHTAMETTVSRRDISRFTLETGESHSYLVMYVIDVV